VDEGNERAASSPGRGLPEDYVIGKKVLVLDECRECNDGHASSRKEVVSK